MSVKGTNTLLIIVRVLIAVAMLMLLVTFPSDVSTPKELYSCLWEDGSRTEENYTSVFSAFDGASETEIFLLRDGMHGVISAGKEYTDFLRLSEEGSPAELLNSTPMSLNRIEHLAAFRVLSKGLWVSGGECFTYTGEGYSATTREDADVVHLLDGSLPKNLLPKSGATRLTVGAQASVTASDLMESKVETLSAAAPYRTDGEVLFLETPGGVRLVAAVPTVVDVVAQYDFADEGALLPCEKIRSLTLPFVGNSPNGAETEFHGELAYLFSTGKEYRVPATLTSVKVTGGKLISYAFYACPSLEEIDACGVRPEGVDEDAFRGCNSLRRLHSPRADILLDGTFQATPLPCGCTLFERI